MFNRIIGGRGLGRSFVLAGIIAGSAVAGLSSAVAGECPADKMKADFRKLTIEPGGIVPWHSHGDRPAIIYVAEGEIVEYASNCSDPIVHKAGEIRAETSGTSHWWQNPGNKTVILFVGDVLHDKDDHNM